MQKLWSGDVEPGVTKTNCCQVDTDLQQFMKDVMDSAIY